jgi:hypothetical protein
MQNETLKFSITLNRTYWDKLPQYSMWVNDDKIVDDSLSEDRSTIEFERDLAEGDYLLKIRLENKTNKDTIIENGEIVKDMLLNIEDIVIDDISLGNLLWDATYILDEPHEFNGKTITQLDHCVNLGWNGTYVLKFSSPFYLWLLEKL